MFRRLSEEEKHTLEVNFKLGAYLVRGMLGIFFVFYAVFFVFGMIENIRSGNWFQIIFALFFGLLFGVIVFGVGLFFVKHVGTPELKALENNKVYLGSAKFVSCSLRKSHSGNRKHFAVLKIPDDYGNYYEKIECVSFSNLNIKFQEGDYVQVLKIVKDSGIEYFAIGDISLH